MLEHAERDALESFVGHMRDKLAENMHKGGREAWIKCPTGYLEQRLDDEVKELLEAMWRSKRDPSGKARMDVMLEAADVGNIAMMIHDREAMRIRPNAPGRDWTNR